MANLTLELNINSASSLLNVNLITKMDVYAKINIRDENTQKKQKAKTTVDRSGGSNPIWNQAAKFSVNERLVRDGRLTLVMRLISRRILGNKEIGRVGIPLLELLNSATWPIGSGNNNQEMILMNRQVRTLSGKQAGFLNFQYRFKSDSPVAVMVNQNLVDHTPAADPPSSQMEPLPLAPPETPIEFPRLPEPPSHSRHPFAVGPSDDYAVAVGPKDDDHLPIHVYKTVTMEQAIGHHNYIPPSPSLQGYEPYDYRMPTPQASLPPAPPSSPIGYDGYGYGRWM
ncbi:PREDICTED: protein SRC2-like [Camelina sativa]|uniref:Protein SRC2-like n=1 Tax=Camelina sativa TaxID=90675 RepID=A0ABM0V690_CAMSA|nr:PREDICTED: protein SRC2-like [Camelina sativa]